MSTPPDGRGTLIQLRRDTAADWAAEDPILDFGEPGFEVDTHVLKIGNGVDPWSALPAIGASAGASGPAGGVLSGTYPNPGFADAVLPALIANGSPGATGLALLLAANQAAGRTTLGLGTAATQNVGAFDSAGSAAAAQAASQPLDSDLTAIAALATTAFGRAFLTLADAAAGRAALALGTAATQNVGAFDSAGSAAAAQAASQPLDSDLTAIAALATTSFGRSLLTVADAATLTQFGSAMASNAQVGTTYAYVLADFGKMVTLNNAAAITLTVPTNASVAFPVGQVLNLTQLGAGQVTITPAGGVTVNGTPGLKTRAQYSAASLWQYAANTWLAFGDLAA